MQIFILTDRFPQGLLQRVEQPRCFFYQSVRGGFAYFETAFAEKLDNPFHRHGVDITQL